MPAEFIHPVHVRYLEVDAQGVVFNMWYLAYVDDALTAFLASNGLAYRDLQSAGYDVQLVHAEMDWSGAVRWGDDVGVAVAVARTGTTSLTLDYRVRAGGADVVRVTVTYVCVSTRDWAKRPLPGLLRAGLGVR